MRERTQTFDSAQLAEQLRIACTLECTAEKPGNVSPNHSFSDVTYADFVRSAEVSAPILATSAALGVGRAIHDAVVATREAVGTNTNLGMLLLLAPLAAIPANSTCVDGIAAVLNSLDLAQTEYIFEAIRIAQPGGLGRAEVADVSQPPAVTICEAMAFAPHDRIAWQYTHNFAEVLEFGRIRFLHHLQLSSGQPEPDWKAALVRVHVEFIAKQSDSLIFRKCGQEIADEAQRRAQRVLDNSTETSLHDGELRQFDHWLREDDHRRNPGTTADILAAMLFAVIRDEMWTPPSII